LFETQLRPWSSEKIDAAPPFSPGIIKRTPPLGLATVSPFVGPMETLRVLEPLSFIGYGAENVRPSSVELTSIGAETPWHSGPPELKPTNSVFVVGSSNAAACD
jgi:hypothetical protein